MKGPPPGMPWVVWGSRPTDWAEGLAARAKIKPRGSDRRWRGTMRSARNRDKCQRIQRRAAVSMRKSLLRDGLLDAADRRRVGEAPRGDVGGEADEHHVGGDQQ